MENTLINQIEQLDKKEKLLLVETIWDSIISDSKNIPLTEYQKSIISERLKTVQEDTENGISWDEFKKNYI
jgi:putative addiction module component (TIGR02574 family)